MKDMGYGANYQYSHNSQGNFSIQEYLPDQIAGTAFYVPSDNKRENSTRAELKRLWKTKYGY
jgi:putative ATPase